MKRLLVAFLALGFTTIVSTYVDAKTQVNGFIYRNANGLSVNTTQQFDLLGYDRASVQVTYSSSTNAAFSANEGAKSVATITVGSTFASLADSTAAVTITVSSNSTGALSGSVVTINGHPFTEGVDWLRGDVSSNTAISLRNTILLYPGLTASTTASSTVVYASATVYGSGGNGYTIISSTPAALVLSAATFTGGRDRGTITIDGTTLTANVDFAVGASTAATASNIATAINANTTLNAIVVSTTAGAGSLGVVYATATVPGINAYALSTSSRAMLTPSDSIFTGGTASEVSSSNDTITRSTHTLTVGMRVLFAANSGTLTGLTSGTSYYAIPVLSTAGSFKLSLTSTGAVAGLAIDISTTAAGGGIYTLTPSTYTGTASFRWGASNDGVNDWVIPSISSVSIPTGTLASTGWDFGNFGYRYLRFVFTQPTSGGVITDISINGKKDD